VISLTLIALCQYKKYIVVTSPTLGLALSSREFVVVVKYRLGLDLIPPGTPCNRCSLANMDTKGVHMINCPSSADRIHRHNAIRDYVFEMAKTAGLQPTKEEVGLCNQNQHPADVFLKNTPMVKHGTVINVSVVNTIKRRYIDSSSPYEETEPSLKLRKLSMKSI